MYYPNFALDFIKIPYLNSYSTISLDHKMIANRYWNIELIDADFENLVIRYLLNLLIAGMVVRLIYYPKTHNKEFFFTFITISVSVFSICYILKMNNLNVGMGLGLFAIFGIIRYRTSSIQIKEMTYLFVLIGLAAINALVRFELSLLELLFINLGAVILMYLLEFVFLQQYENSICITYDNIVLIQTNNMAKIKSDLENITGMKISKISIGKQNYLEDTVEIQIYYIAD